MGCPYCGGPVPKNKVGRPRRFCSDRCAKNYNELLWQRRRKGCKVPLMFCKNCGQVLKKDAKDYCSDECRKRAERPEYQIAGINALRFAALRQAKKDKALKTWMMRKSFYELYPELTPDQFKGGTT